MDRTPAQRVARIKANAVGRDLSSWEKHEFLPSIEMRTTLTKKQEEVLTQIERNVFGRESSE